jgi:predicted phosphohydrolase
MSLSLCIGADLHGALPLVPRCDLLLLLGDILPPGDIAMQKSWEENVFLPWISSQPAREKVLLAGNHDFLWEKSPPRGDFHYLQDSALEVFGLRLWGLPWTPPKGETERKWAFRKREKALGKILKRARRDTDILLSHGPPWGIGDWTGARHGGSTALLEAIERIDPRAVFFGHIDQGSGPTVVNGRLFLNASMGKKKKDFWRVEWSTQGIFWER